MIEGWQERKLGDVCDKVGEYYQPKSNGNNPYIGLEHIEPGCVTIKLYGLESEVTSSKTKFNSGQILYGKLRPYLDKAVIASFDGVCSTDIIVIDCNGKSINNFLIYLIHSNDFISYAKSTTSGVQHPRTSWNSLRNFNFLLPPLPEQSKIAYVLTTIQRAIEQQNKLIRTATELKKALMQKLFTEGIQGEKQKQTEIGWVPESWEVVKIDTLFDIQQGKQVSKANRVGNNQKAFLRTANLFWGYIDFSELDKMHFTKDEETRFTLKKNDLLVCEGGDVGRTAVWDYDIKDIYYQNHIHRLRKKSDKILPKYFMYWMSRIVQETSYVKDAGNVTTIPNLSKSRLGGLLFPKPTTEYQKEVVCILEALDLKCEFYKKKKQIISELFKTLLHDLMTGQRRVYKIDFDGMNKEYKFEEQPIDIAAEN